MGPIYCFLDIEVDGPTPGANSMLSLGFAAFDEDERELDVFEINLDTSEGASDAENVMNQAAIQAKAVAHSQPFSGAAERRALCPCNGHHPRTLATHSGGQVRTH